MPAPVVAAEPPPGWVAAEIERPPLAASTGATWSSWHAARSKDDAAALVTACVTAPVPGWVEDMRPPLTARTVALAAAAATRIHGAPVETFDDPPLLGLRPVGASAPALGAAKTFLGFDDASVATCFVVCVARGAPSAASAACSDVVVRARLDGGEAPPPPGGTLRAVTWAVHNPRPFALGFGVATVLAGAIAIATRRKPRAHP